MANKLTDFKLPNTYRARFAIIMSLAVLVLVFVIILVSRPPLSPIPKSIISAVSFPVYYPDQSKLPAGYVLSQSSIQLIKPGVVIYSIAYGKQKMIVVSEQSMPDNSTINHFTSDYIPLHSSFTAPSGNATVGAYNDGNSIRSVVSLPVNKGPWLIITAPGNLNHSVLEQVVDSLVKS